MVSTRDVPGFDRSIIPALNGAGIKGLSIGMNGRIFPPNVPSAFVWKDTGVFNRGDSPQPGPLTFTQRDYGAAENDAIRNTTVSPPSGEETVVLWHPRGYGGLGDYVTVPGLSHALAYDWRSDNGGPPMSVGEVLSGFETVRKAFPNATVVASTLDAFVEELLAVKDALPVIDQEARALRPRF